MYDLIITWIVTFVLTIFVILIVWKSKEIFSKPFIFKILDNGNGIEVGIFWIILLLFFMIK